MKIVIAIDSFKGCLSSVEANRAATEGILSVCPDAEIVQVPVSDGGEGFLEAFHAVLGGELQEIVVSDPLMRPVTASYLLRGDEAVIEISQASGLTLLAPEERNPMVATSYGTGQLVVDAVRRGAKHIIVGLGGSATSDAGMGMLKALVDAWAKQGTFDDIRELRDVRFTIASEPAMVPHLDERARKFAELSARHFGYDCSAKEGAGAAGGLGYAFLQYLHAACRPGIELLLDIIHFNETVRDADLVITGEGSADRQTLMGKLPMGILRHSAGIPVWLIAGRISDRDQLLQAGFSRVACINPPAFPLEEAMRQDVARQHIINTFKLLIF